MSDDETEHVGGLHGGEIRDSFDRRFVLLSDQARAQGLVLLRNGDKLYWLVDAQEFGPEGDEVVVYETERPGLDGLEDIGAWLIANR